MLLRLTLGRERIKMKTPKTTSEHIIALYGYITGLRRDVNTIKNKVKELWNKHSHCVICAVAGFVLGAIIV